ncbi:MULTISPECIES: ornithine cyclodeaminase family protein [Leisingera]|uniref:ornithine cyclodeaminase family protein n=1 Tax=Leisingera TaxID=191028 RepID=UPI0004842034|nr:MULTISPECIES: ornithine cyclodeaminase family protein [Leisingera]MBY6059561.1 ornithine cyclodeaminase family protein [Leisingera daeponensis]
MKVLDLEATRAALPFDKLVEAIDHGFRGEYETPLRHQHNVGNTAAEDDVILLMPAWQQEGFGGVKLVNVVPGNTSRDLPAISSSYILFDRDTGEHLMMLDGGELTARRTAAASALAARRLARPDSSAHLIIGAGRVGRNLALSYREVLPIEHTLVHDLRRENAERMAADLNALGITADVIDTAEEGIAEADVVSCATLAKSPVIKGKWLRSGQHIDLIGSFTPEMREADDHAIERASVFIDTEDALRESGDLITPIQNGVLARSEIAGTLKNICADNAFPRGNHEEITLFKGVGTAIEDLSAAILAYKQS